MKFNAQTVILGALTTFTIAEWRFRSRPEFVVPRLNITVPAARESVEKGLIFIAPYPAWTKGSTGPVQPAAYIFRDDGELVWSGVGYHAGWVANFRPDIWNGKSYLRAFQGSLDRQQGRMYGYHTLLGSDYEVVKTVRVGSHRLASAHEFRIVNGRTALIETPITRPVSLKPWGGSEEQVWIVSGGFQEVDIETGEVLFDWESFDHVDPKYSAFPLDSSENIPGVGRNQSNAWNYFHVNSIDKDDEGNYLISARNVAAVYKINGTSGEIIWQLGGLHGGSSFRISPDDYFAYQHDARFLSRSADGTLETISLFDNSAHSADVKINPYSRARIFELNHTDGTGVATHTYGAPDALSAYTQGNAQVLPNGNVFVNWGQAGAVTEFGGDGEVLFHSYLDSAPLGANVQSYRGFRYNWTGTPAEEPAVVAYWTDSRQQSVDVYASWNGDTEVASWRFYVRTPSHGAEEALVVETTRRGFETHAKVNTLPLLGKDYVITAEATDASGRVLVRSKSVTVTTSPVEAISLTGLEPQLSFVGEL